MMIGIERHDQAWLWCMASSFTTDFLKALPRSSSMGDCVSRENVLGMVRVAWWRVVCREAALMDGIRRFELDIFSILGSVGPQVPTGTRYQGIQGSTGRHRHIQNNINTHNPCVTHADAPRSRACRLKHKRPGCTTDAKNRYYYFFA
jgi:hypothetical protein